MFRLPARTRVMMTESLWAELLLFHSADAAWLGCPQRGEERPQLQVMGQDSYPSLPGVSRDAEISWVSTFRATFLRAIITSTDSLEEWQMKVGLKKQRIYLCLSERAALMPNLTHITQCNLSSWVTTSCLNMISRALINFEMECFCGQLYLPPRDLHLTPFV